MALAVVVLVLGDPGETMIANQITLSTGDATSDRRDEYIAVPRIAYGRFVDFCP